MRMIHNSIQTTGRSEVKPLPSLGFSRQERSEYSIVRALRNFMLFQEGKKTENGIEMEAHAAIEKLTGRCSQGLLIPTSDLNWQTRSVLQTSQQELGGYMVGTELRGSDFISALRAKTVVSRMGAKIYADLVGNLDIPKVSSTASTYWLSEGESIPPSNLELSLVSLRPRTVGAIVPITRRLLMQSSGDAEGIVRSDLLSQIALAMDSAAVVGTGLNNEPLGILNTPGVGTVAIGANGGALSWQHIVDMETEVSSANADQETCSYLTNSQVKGAMKTTPKVVGQNAFLVDTMANPAYGQPGESRSLSLANGYPLFSSNLVPGNLSKGNGINLSALIFGDFTQLLMATWGILELLPNPYGSGFEQNILQIRALSDCDIAVRHSQAFAVCTDIVTT